MRGYLYAKDICFDNNRDADIVNGNSVRKG